jgi:hypothetical protein
MAVIQRLLVIHPLCIPLRLDHVPTSLILSTSTTSTASTTPDPLVNHPILSQTTRPSNPIHLIHALAKHHPHTSPT